MRKNVLNPHVERCRGTLACFTAAKLFIEPEFQARDTVAVRIGHANNLCRGTARRVIAFGSALEIEPRQTEMHHRIMLIGGNLAGNQDIISCAVENPVQPQLAAAGNR